ncbi:hypothetical protein EVAR_3871_1 [Eumeta japonica]|uniref:Uncharacterized protein n=1 Tax=Eumeta variegata TaxID=151549 RepID=A0A4C1SQT1_EUMVA|nr:hypothetical protein EVAR_3871_1 [Eumeta japonica]
MYTGFTLFGGRCLSSSLVLVPSTAALDLKQIRPFFAFSYKERGCKNFMSCHAPACVGCVRLSRTKTPSKNLLLGSAVNPGAVVSLIRRDRSTERYRRHVTLLRGVCLNPLATESHERFRRGLVPLGDTDAR